MIVLLERESKCVMQVSGNWIMSSSLLILSPGYLATHWTQTPVFCILYSVFCILYSVFCILYSVFCILYSVFCILYSVFCITLKLTSFLYFGCNILWLARLIGCYCYCYCYCLQRKLKSELFTQIVTTTMTTSTQLSLTTIEDEQDMK